MNNKKCENQCNSHFKGILKRKSRKNCKKKCKKKTNKNNNKNKNNSAGPPLFHICGTRKKAMDNAIKEYNTMCLPSLSKNTGDYARLGSIQPKPRPANYAMLTRGRSRSGYPFTVRPVYKTIATTNKNSVPSDAIYESINRNQLSVPSLVTANNDTIYEPINRKHLSFPKLVSKA